jgi:chemotaxis protein MotB
MTTFADMVTLLLAFFVLMLSFTEMSVPKFKEVSGSMNDVFGAQRADPVADQPQGATVRDLNFSPSSTVALVENITPETTVTARPAAQDGSGPDSVEQDAATIRQALAAEVAAGVVAVRASATRVIVAFNPDANASNIRQFTAAQAVASGVRKLTELTPRLRTEVAVIGATKTLVEVAGPQGRSAPEGREGDGRGPDGVDAVASSFEAAFAGEIRDGLVAVERKDGAVVVKVGSGGAFPTGDATLTPLVARIIEKIGTVAKSADARIVIGGHTDNVPISTMKYRDNWDLSAARAVSVVRELVVNRGFEAAKIEAQGFADTRPVAGNGTAIGRSLNRRIEIEVRLAEAL